MILALPDGVDPLWLAAGAAACVLLILLLTLRAAGRAGRMAEPMLRELGWMSQRVQGLADGQERLAGGLTQVSETQAVSQTAMLQLMERRLAQVQASMAETLTGTATRTARSLGELHQRLETIDKAQANIEKLSGNVLSLQDILSNKQTRGAFGEIQLNDLVRKALPPDAYDRMNYYERWVTSITQTMIQRGLITTEELGRKMADVEKRDRSQV